MASSSGASVSKEKKIEHIVEHYQKTFEMNYQLWKERNNYFLILVAFVAGATLLFSLGKNNANSLIVTWIGNLIGLKENQSNPFATGANFELLQLLVLAVVFYLMLSLYRYTQDVMRTYAYLGELENEIQKLLNLGNSAVFTRENKFYRSHRSWLVGTIGIVYTVILALLLGAFLWLRLSADWPQGFDLAKIDFWQFADIFLAFAITVFFIGYAGASISWFGKKLEWVRNRILPNWQRSP
jgi:phosphate/sulfate permease